MIGIERNQDPDQYLFLVGMATKSSNLNSRTAEANVIFMDGTVSTIDIDTRKSTANIANTELVDVATATMNTWCTYTVNSDNVYTLHEVGTTLGTDDAAQSHDTNRDKIDKSHISLDGAATTPKRVYGNDETVYLVVDLDLIDSATRYGATYDAVIIDDVASVITGVENADIEVWDHTTVTTRKYPGFNAQTAAAPANDQNASNGVYVLYDEDAYVIGAVVVGEDAGSTTNFVYTISDNANRESYSSADDEYTWTRPVALEGLEAEISYVDDSLAEIGKADMDPEKWYYVRYYADGTVKDTQEVVTGTPVNGYQVVGSILDAVTRIDANPSAEHVLLNNAPEKDLVFKNGTLYSDVSDDEGIWISPDVNVVRIQNVDGDRFGEIEYYEGRDGLEDALEDMLVDADDTVKVSAIIEDGAAMVVILNNQNNKATDEGESTPTPGGKYSRVVDTTAKLPAALELKNASIDNNGHLKMPYVASEDVYTQMEDALTALGYTDIEISRSGSTYTATAYNARGYRETIDFAPGTDGTEFFIVTIDEEIEEYVESGDPTTTLNALTGDAKGFIHKMGNAAFAYAAYGATEYSPVSGDVEVLTGYVEVTASSITDNQPSWNAVAAVAIPDYLTAGDTFDVLVTRTSAKVYGESDFKGFTWTVDAGSDAVLECEAELTTPGTATVAPQVTIHVTVTSVSDTVDTLDVDVDAIP